MRPVTQRLESERTEPAQLRLGLRRWGLPHACLAVFALCWVGLAIAPVDRATWLLESIPTLLVLPGIFMIYRRGLLSNRSYVLSTVFLLLHTVGSHYTYSHVPLGEWVRELFALSRNHYDRLVHFSFGLLLLLPNLELALGPAPGRRPWVHYYLAFATIAWWSVFYELLEWLTAHVVDPAAGTAFLGTQGDAWDSQQDMAVACIGAAAAVAIEWFRTAVPTPPR